MMSEPNPVKTPNSPNEHAHTFAAEASEYDAVEYARVKRGVFNGNYAVLRITDVDALEQDMEGIARLATTHGVTNIDRDPVLKRVTFNFSRSSGGA